MTIRLVGVPHQWDNKHLGLVIWSWAVLPSGGSFWGNPNSLFPMMRPSLILSMLQMSNHECVGGSNPVLIKELWFLHKLGNNLQHLLMKWKAKIVMQIDSIGGGN